MSKAKDFQKATAERILHIYKDIGHRRVLLADEVGLGKTFVARQVISLVREWRKNEKDDFFRVVYICSNANIANQNIEKLGVGNKMNISESRLSMQHLFITLTQNQIKGKVASEMPESIIPLTPTTSFRFYSAQGTANERALMFNHLRRLECFKSIENALSGFLSCDVKNWEYLINYYESEIERCGEDYKLLMQERLIHYVTKESVLGLTECALKKIKGTSKSDIINSFRRYFAEISIEMLDPDLVVMDEFQKFNDLLVAGDSEQSMLANKFFDPEHTNTKILLLSATPYKLYTTLEEINVDGRDEHYQDFMKLVDFLFINKDKSNQFRLKWHSFSNELKRTEVRDITPLLQSKQEAESILYEVMCRTERFNSGIIDDSKVCTIPVQKEDIVAFAEGQKLLEYISKRKPKYQLGRLPMEYVKSSPYLLSFMNQYQLKKSINSAIKGTSIMAEVSKSTLLLPKNKINNYQHIEPGNGKLKYLHNLVFGEKHEKKVQYLLWVPASNPYYEAGGVFETGEAKRFSKIILFSSWEMVPRMVSAMMSYYAELYTIGEVKKNMKNIRYISTQNNRHGENRLKPDNLLEYPSRLLCELYNPKEFYGKKAKEIQKIIAHQVENILTESPITKDLPRQKRDNAKMTLSLLQLLDGETNINIEELYIPSNAVDVMTDMAIASPAICAYRLSRDIEDAKIAAKAIVSVFNKPESAAVIDLLYNKKSDEDYYESVLDYCVKGNLQSVLDEYAHMLETACIGKELNESILGTSTIQVDTIDSMGDVEEKKLPMRNHFAIPFIDKTLTDKSVARTANIRKAFNSPFRPFILSTTSIGQEGLDFHWYSRIIVHWNLPSNPVDLEQREGRINRYKCLAIRRNLSRIYANEETSSWDDIFSVAKNELKGTYSDMVPYWCLPINSLNEEQQAKLEFIERIVPLYPFSRDVNKYEHLIKVLSLYRMTLGQPRQEELLHLLKQMKLSDEQLKELTINLCPFNKPNN